MKRYQAEYGDIPSARPVSGSLRKTGQRVEHLRILPVLMLIGVLACCLTVKSSGQDAAALAPHMESWLRGTDRDDFPWKVKLLNPKLTFQQRLLVEVQAVIRAEDLGERDHEWTLLFTVAVKDGQGRWIQDPRPTTVELPAKLGSQEDVFYSRGIYLRPGSYVIAVVSYDTGFRQANVRFSHIHIPALKNDPLSNLKLLLPEVEFVPSLPGSFRAKAGMIDRFYRLALEPLPLPVENTGPVRIDFVLNVAGSLATTAVSDERPDAGTSPQSAFSSLVLQTGNFLSQMDLKSGCVRATIVDLRRMQMIVDRQEPRNLKWGELEASFLRWDNTIDVGSLQNRYQQSAFLYEVLERITSDSYDCCAKADNLEHIVAIIGQDLQFPDGTVMRRLDPSASKHCRFYYFLFGYPNSGNTISRMLNALHPRRLRFDSSQSFRQAAARFLADITK